MNHVDSEKKVYEALQWASSFLQSGGYEDRIGEILLLHHTGWSRSKLFSEMQTALSTEVWRKFQEDVEKAASGVPVQYITGVEEFYGRTFNVSPDVLIPRPETEELIATVLELVNSPVRVVDIGTGSGIIAITLSLELLGSEVHAVDISLGALNIARGNSERFGANVTFHEGDLLQPLLSAGEKFSVVVSNPPYIPEGDRAIMMGNVLDHEPELALFAGDDGLDIYKRLITQIPHVLLKPGVVAFEIGHNQGKAVKELLQHTFPKAKVEVKLDINGKERIVYAIVH